MTLQKRRSYKGGRITLMDPSEGVSKKTGEKVHYPPRIQITGEPDRDSRDSIRCDLDILKELAVMMAEPDFQIWLDANHGK